MCAILSSKRVKKIILSVLFLQTSECRLFSRFFFIETMFDVVLSPSHLSVCYFFSLSLQVANVSASADIEIRMYILSLIPAVVLLGQVRSLKYMVPFSMLANICMMSGFAITLYYVFSNVQPISSVKLFSSVEQLPRFFATVIFAIEGIGVVSSTLPM